MKTNTRLIAALVFGIYSGAASAQSNPGPPSGGGIDRSYDDGYVFADATEDAGGYTSYWGYQNASQIQGRVIAFHSTSSLDPATIELITDSYSLGSLPIPPTAPYSGGFSGLGPTIPDAPFSRLIEEIAVPEASSLQLLTLGASSFAGIAVLRRRVPK